ncbi:MAG: hypothetical protein JW885_16085 [Deltaproteobacteria bacterium]|nr:hypothetical protein [Candidatus Zymogenaceae bacterium]
MRRRTFFSLVVLAATVLLVAPVIATAQDYLYVEEANFYSVPKALPYHDGSFGGKDFLANPALMAVENDVLFFLSSYYLGSTTDVDVDGFYTVRNIILPPIPGSVAISGDEKYQVNNWVTDAGFTLGLSDAARFGFFLRYRYGDVGMEGDTTFTQTLTINNVSHFSDYSSDSDVNDISLALLLDLDLAEAFSMGVGFKYDYVIDRSDFDLSSAGTAAIFNPNEISTMSRSFDMDYHRFAPVLGFSVAPTDALSLDMSVEMGFIVGGVEEGARFYSNHPIIPAVLGLQTHTHAFDSRDLDGWDIGTGLDVAYALNDTISMPFFADFAYATMDWSLDGTGTGLFFPTYLTALPTADGLTAHENDYAEWSLSGGAGVDLALDPMDLGFALSYTHWEYANDYWYRTVMASTLFGPFVPGNAAVFDESVSEKRNVFSLDVTMEKDFSDSLSAAFGMRYDLGWGVMDLDRSYRSAFLYVPPVPTLTTSYDDRDFFHNLTLAADVSFMPVDRLTLSLGGMVRIPLDGLDYELDGSGGGTYNGIPALGVSGRFDYNGPASFGYDTTTWEYGGRLELKYEF